MEPWKTLESAGVPLGAIRAAPRTLDRAAVRDAVATVGRAPVLGLERDALLAWLRGWRHHWPASFDEALGEAGHALITRLEAGPYDMNRYLKLRRIAIENLSHAL